MKTLIFNLWGQWGHFRTYYSTSSPLTYSVIPPTSAFGVLGAILGLNKENNEYLKVLREANTKIAISLNKAMKDENSTKDDTAIKDEIAIQKARLGVNLIDTKHHFWKIHNRTQIRTEYLRNASYKLFISIEDDELMCTLIDRVKAHKTYYTVSLGLSEMIADFGYENVVDFSPSNSENYIDIHSIIPMGLLAEEKGIEIEEGKWYKKEMLPIIMDENRIVHKYEECLFEMHAKPIKAKLKQYWSCGDYNIVFLNYTE